MKKVLIALAFVSFFAGHVKSQDLLPSQDPNPKAQMRIQEDRALTMNGKWEVVIDTKEYKIEINGGDVTNKWDTQADNVTMDLFLTSEKQSNITGNFSGLKIASANLGPLAPNNTNRNVNIKANLLQNIPSGTYYILLTLSKTDQEGNQSVRTKRVFENPVLFQ